MNKISIVFLLLFLFVFVAISGCIQQKESDQLVVPNRESKIPFDAMKMTPEIDVNPPLIHSEEWNEPVPLSYPINTAGAEDSAFILPDGNTLYFFCTPDVTVPAENQILDGVTGIYVSTKNNTIWSKPQRVLLQDSGKLALDGAEFIMVTTMWFVSAREGYTGLHWFTAEWNDGIRSDWQNADFNSSYEVGELHITDDGSELYFHSDRDGGRGGLDICVSKNVNNEWQDPENVAAVYSARDEGWSFVTLDNNELWISRDFGLWR
jgi:hypothetical protein